MALSAGWRLGNYYEENDTVPTDFPPSPIWPQNNEQDAFFPSLHLSGRRISELYTKTPWRTVKDGEGLDKCYYQKRRQQPTPKICD